MSSRTHVRPVHPRPAHWWLGVAAALALLLGAPASPALAHDELLQTDPAAGSTVDALPAELTLRYSGDLIADEQATEVMVTDAEGASLDDGSPRVQGATVRQSLTAPAGFTGTVVVTWRVVSSDGHPISGRFVFGVGVQPSDVPVPASPDAESQSTMIVVVGVGLGILVLVGAAVAVRLWIVRRKPQASEPDSH